MRNGDVAPVMYLIREVARAFRRQLEVETRRHDLTLTQWRIIGELGLRGGVSQVALANAVDSDPMTLSGVLRRLEDRGLVTRDADPKDSRAKIVSLTAAGEDLFGTVEALGGEIYKIAIAGMSQEDIDALSGGLARVRDNLTGSDADQKEIA